MQRQKLKFLFTACAGGLIGLLSMVRVVHAETHITDGYLYNSAVWTRAESPYIVESTVSIPKDISLTVESGVSIVGDSAIEGYDLFDVQGSLVLNGKANERISISGFGGVTVSFGSVGMKYTDISLPEGLGIYNGLADVYSSTITGADTGIRTRSSLVSVDGSRIFGNRYGIFVEDPNPPGIFQVRAGNSLNGVGGLGNFFAIENQSTSSVVTITDSAITDNTDTAIKNNDTREVSASKNWWGSNTGPSFWNVNRIVGPVAYAPWLEKDPFATTTDPECCSSVLFIPGLEGSRLYRNEEIPVIGSTVNRLWEPNRNADVKKLYLNSSGSSTDKTIYSGGPVGKALGLVDIYGDFMDFLNGIQTKGTINEWKAFGYDWRKPITEVVAGSEMKATTTESLIQTVADLAEHSKTGKVTLIAHSNGGLVAKYLVKTLEEMGKSGLIDSVISVAVPYLGTPEAILGLLHGYGQSIAGGFIVNESTMRSLGVNMASAYSLLPSREYFSKVFGPTIAFASTTIKGINDGSYPQNISSYEDQVDFIADTKNTRVNPEAFATSLPIKGNKALLTASNIIHGVLDPFSWPTSIAMWSIAGWGKGTSKGIEYYEKVICEKIRCTNLSWFKPVQTKMGDGTVVAPSAVYNSGTVLSLDLDDISKQENRDIAHANILGASSTKTTIENIISHNPADDNQVVIDKISKIPGVTIGEPDYSKEPVSLVLSTHSPVDLHVYDSKGNHTGLASKPIGLDEDVEDGLYTFYDKKIIGSSFERIPDPRGGYENYIYLPDDDGEKYTVIIEGNGFGEFTYDVERVRGSESLDKIEFQSMPVTPLTIATTTITARASESAVLPMLASTSLTLSIDIDGNGTSDIKATSTTKIGEVEYFKSLRTTIGTLVGNIGKGKNIIKRLDKIDDLMKKGKLKQAHKVSDDLDERIGHMKLKKLTEAQKKELLDMVELYISQYE
ncbi:MAG: hypothetical protein WCS89_04430 [Candidatus Paceibacterota bacterium]